MNARKFIAVAASVLILSACGVPAPMAVSETAGPAALDLNDDQSVATASSVQREEHNRTTVYRGPNAASKPSDQVFIRAVKTDAGGVDYQIYVVIGYNGNWRFYNWAHDANGNSLYLSVLTRKLAPCKRDDCLHNEHLIIDVTREYLEENVQSGFRFWVSAKEKEGKEVFFIPPGYIRAFLSLVE